MPDLENLKKQAKRVLKWHRDGYHPVASQIRSTLERFHGLDDREVLAAPFRLRDAQELVARMMGFSNWPALVQGLRTMSDHTAAPASAPKLLAVEPQLLVADVAASVAFYARLGFTQVFAHGAPAFYAQVSRDALRLNLRHVDGAVLDPTLRSREADILSATFLTTEVKSLFLEFRSNGIAFHQTLRAEPWGAQTFIVADPDGNLIAFAG